MKRSILTVALLISVAYSPGTLALDAYEAEELADLTAVFVYLKNDCGYQELPDVEIRRALVLFAQQNRWDLSNYGAYNMRALGEESYNDLSGIAIPGQTKCNKLANSSLGLLAYVK